jgi:hypothetical protein
MRLGIWSFAAILMACIPRINDRTLKLTNSNHTYYGR